jgi:hypothetical protein
MTFDYEKLERDLEEACEAVHQDFLKKFNSDDSYTSIGGAKLEAFINDLKAEFEGATFKFLEENNLTNDPEAKKRALTIAKLYAKKCMDDFSKVLR